MMAIALGYLLELDGKSLLLMATLDDILESGHGETKLILSYKLHPYGLAFIMLKRSHSTTGENVFRSLTQL